MNGIRRCWLIALALLALSSAALAQQPDEASAAEARRLYTDARKAMSDKKYSEAALGFEAASRLVPHAVALYTAAQAWELAGEPARAADAYARALATPKLNESQAERSRERLAALEQLVGTVVITGSESSRVQLDDHMEVNAPARLHGAAGERTLTITRADGTPERRAVSLVAGDSIEVDVDAREEVAAPEAPAKQVVPLAPPARQPIKVEQRSPSAWQTVGFVTTGAGLAALGGAVLFGMSAKDAEETYRKAPTRATFDHAKSLETRTNVLFVVGGVLTTAGVGLVVWQALSPGQERAALSVRAAPGSLIAEGSF
jgi:hypothetical protein